MPAERSKATKRSGDDVPQLVWTLPVEPYSSVEADDLTTPSSTPSPITCDDGPPPLVDPSDFIFFPPADYSAPPRKPAHSKKKPEDHIPRPPNAFILFRSSFIKGQHVPTEVETNHSTLSKIIGLTWKNLPEDERRFWHAKAKAALDEHKRKFPQYAFRPNQSRNKGATEKRKVREVGPKDHKRCAKIAELLVEGKKGHELDEAIQEFDKHHVPEVITRFEAPITARTFRRSSSAPAADKDEQGKPRKVRSASTQPATPVAASVQPLPETTTEVRRAESFMPTFEQYSLSAAPSPSFDFNTFSFDNHSSPMSPYPVCDPLSQPPSPMVTADMMFSSASNASAGLSIDTSFLALDDWNCPSPPSSDSSMPATPYSMNSPSADTYPSYTLQSFEETVAKSLGAHCFPAYPNNGCHESHESQFPGVVHFDAADSPSVYPTFVDSQGPDCSLGAHVHMANQDHDFSAFMASLPEYVLSV
ncbi:putative high mobility group [Lyophyllum shimeji]|uniref:High mobility group n=1 Tax=Lyophyllum shimeji TaxID=47721 RepID=A0A9P3PW27_LYOSH|nr:putative high mobility group [Lyophyllum shimeji]